MGVNVFIIFKKSNFKKVLVPEVRVVQFLRLMFVEDRVQGGVLAADVEDVTEVLDLLGGADPARDELLPLTHLLRQLVLQRRDLHGKDSVVKYAGTTAL